MREQGTKEMIEILDDDYIGDMTGGYDVAGKLVHEMHALADRLPSSDAMVVRAGAGEILLLRSVVRDILNSVDQSRVAPALRRRAQAASQGFSE